MLTWSTYARLGGKNRPLSGRQREWWLKGDFATPDIVDPYRKFGYQVAGPYPTPHRRRGPHPLPHHMSVGFDLLGRNPARIGFGTQGFFIHSRWFPAPRPHENFDDLWALSCHCLSSVDWSRGQRSVHVVMQSAVMALTWLQLDGPPAVRN
jgi:hypothetical protein